MTNFEKPSARELKANEAVSNVFDLLFKQVVRVEKKDSKNTQISRYFWNEIAPTLFLKICVIGTIFFFLVAGMSAIINQSIILAGRTILTRTIYLVITFIFFVSFEISWLFRLIQQLKGAQKQLEEDFYEAKDDATLVDWQIVEDIIKKANQQPYVLEYVGKKISHLIEQSQNKAKVNYVFIRILAFLIVGIFIGIYLPYDLLLKIITSSQINVWVGTIALLSTLQAAIVLIFDFILSSITEFKTGKLKKCLYLLDQAKLRVNNISNSQEVTQPKQSDTKQSLMSKLKNIKIDGPDDFATNFDLYLSGDKRIEPDIR